MPTVLESMLMSGFMRQAALAGLLASLACGIMGAYVVIRRISFIAGGISHAVLAGMGCAVFFHGSPLWGAAISAVLVALVIGWLHQRTRESEDTLIASVWTVGMAVGVLFIYKTPGYAADLFSYIFGNILLVSGADLKAMAAFDVFILVSVFAFYRRFMAVCYDEEFARIQGVSTRAVYMFLLCLVALTVVLLVQVVGVILAMALLTIPAAIASRWTTSLSGMMALATVLGALFTLLGLAIAYPLDLPAGATVVLIAGAFYIFFALGRLSQR